MDRELSDYEGVKEVKDDKASINCFKQQKKS
jgi:hypothetical protein